jgi:hypothetical protein
MKLVETSDVPVLIRATDPRALSRCVEFIDNGCGAFNNHGPTYSLEQIIWLV